ncbi:MAG: endonuclease/exonuclease/phosphatase family protein [Clostridium sp.]|nr:endonuclease/exonuclease/phosphatase family protein [Clostridium sp.]
MKHFKILQIILTAGYLVLTGSCTTPKRSCGTTREISVLQFNVWQEGTSVEGGYEAMVDEIVRLSPTFVTLSEVRNYRNTRFCDRITESLRQRGLTYYSFYSYDSGLLSRYPITDSTTIYPIQGDHGTIYKLATDVEGRRTAVYTAHLDYQNDTYYEVRGYDGNNWHRMNEPLTDVTEILRRNNLSMRDEAITAFLADAEKEVQQGSLIFLGGDFNEPSHQDWIEVTRDSADHQGLIVPWPATTRLTAAGYADAYRTRHPNPVTHPGYTYPANNPVVSIKQLSWAPESDERERIDYIFYRPCKGLTLTDAVIVGPQGCIRRGERTGKTGQDSIVAPIGIWPSDHKAVLTTFRLK